MFHSQNMPVLKYPIYQTHRCGIDITSQGIVMAEYAYYISKNCVNFGYDLIPQPAGEIFQDCICKGHRFANNKLW